VPCVYNKQLTPWKDYQGARTSKAMADFALGQLPSKQITAISKEAALDAFLKDSVRFTLDAVLNSDNSQRHAFCW
jgi:hypothetical protein